MSDEYKTAHDRLVWLDQLDTDFNRPGKLNEDGDLVWFGRIFAHQDKIPGKVGDVVFIGGGGSAEEGCPGVIGRIIEIDPEIHQGKEKWDNWAYARAKQVDWAVIDLSALNEQ